MLGGVTRHMLLHLPGVPQLHVNRPYITWHHWGRRGGGGGPEGYYLPVVVFCA